MPSSLSAITPNSSSSSELQELKDSSASVCLVGDSGGEGDGTRIGYPALARFAAWTDLTPSCLSIALWREEEVNRLFPDLNPDMSFWKVFSVRLLI